MNDKEYFKMGDKVSDFVLNDHNGKGFHLREVATKHILLSFHPLAWTGVCAKQMKSLEENYKIFKDLDTIAVGINVDSVPSKKAWAESLNIKNTRLLSDFWPHGKVAKLYKIFREKEGFSERANILINENFEIEFFKLYEIPEFPDIFEIITYLENI